MKEIIDVNVSYDTSFEDIELLRSEMEKFVRHPDNARDFQPDLTISVFGVGDLDKLQLKVTMKHKSNWHNEAFRATRRSKFMCALAMALKKVPVNGPGGGGEPLGGPSNPSYAVAISDDIAAVSRDKAAQKKDALRMVPKNPARTTSTASRLGGTKEAEKKAAKDLNTRNSALEAADGWGLTVDDNTLNSTPREESLERIRSNYIEAVRQELLGKRESQRGRRQAGQAVPPMPLGANMPAMKVSQADANRRSGPRSDSFDVESQTGGQAGFAQQGPYGNTMTTNTAGAAAAAQVSGYSVFPPPRPAYSPPTSSSSNLAGIQGMPQPHPLQSAPLGSIGRARGGSVARSQLGDLPGQGAAGQRQY